MTKKKKKFKKLKPKMKQKEVVLRTQKQNLGRGQLSAHVFRLLMKMTHGSKALRNVGLYEIRQSFFSIGKIPTDKEIDNAMKDDLNFKSLQSNSVQAVRNTLLAEVKSYFEAIKAWKRNPSDFTGKPKFPTYSRSTEKRIIEIFQVPKVDKEGFWKIPMSNEFRAKNGTIKIKMPQNLRHKKIQYIEIIPKQKGRFFEVRYVYEVDVPKMKKAKNTTTKALGIDLGVDRLLSCATSTGETFCIDGKKLKSVNQYFNKTIANQQEKNAENGISRKVITKKQATLWMKRECQINGYITQAVGLLMEQVRALGIDTIVVGKNKGWKQQVDMGAKNNQKFVQIPFNQLISAIQNKCEKEGIRFIEQEESYTSKASFLDKDEIPVYKKGDKTIYRFSGKREKRGLYISKDNRKIHADINAALNILRKSKVVDVEQLNRIQTPKVLFVKKRKQVA